VNKSGSSGGDKKDSVLRFIKYYSKGRRNATNLGLVATGTLHKPQIFTSRLQAEIAQTVCMIYVT